MLKKSNTPIIIASIAIFFLMLNTFQTQAVKETTEFSHSESITIDRNKQNETKAQKIELPADFQYPNGITRANDGTLYVGSITSGQILQIAPDGRITTFFPGRESVFCDRSCYG